MRSDHHVQIVPLKEGVQVVWTEVDDVVLLLRVTIEVVSEAIFFFCFMRVTPEKIDDLLLVLGVVTSELDVEWSWDSFNSLNILNGWSDSSVTAKDLLLFVINNSS